MPLANKYDARLKAIAVVNSCTTLEQLQVARNFATRALRLSETPLKPGELRFFNIHDNVNRICDPVEFRILHGMSKEDWNAHVAKMHMDRQRALIVQCECEHMWEAYESQKRGVNVSVEVKISV